MNSSGPDYLPIYIEKAREWGLLVHSTRGDYLTSYSIQSDEGSPLKIRSDVSLKSPYMNSIWGFVKTSSWQFNGERSDLNDLISCITALLLRTNGISVSMLTVDHPVLDEPSGVYARVFTYERHGLINFKYSETLFEPIRSIFGSFVMTEAILGSGFSPEDNEYPVYAIKSGFGEEWASQVAKFLHEDIEDLETHNYMARTNPDFNWFHSIISGISVFSLNERFLTILKMAIGMNKCQIINGPLRKIISYGNLLNSVTLNRYELALNLMMFLEGKDERPDDPALIAIENYFFLLGRNHIVSVMDDCGLKSVSLEKEAIKERQNLENKLLFPPINFVWAKKIDGGRFESMIRELLMLEPGVERVRQISNSNEPDGGRDLEAEWITKKTANIQNPEVSPYQKIKVLIQCKAYNRSIGKAQVQDIRDTIDKYNADGYFLIVSTALSTPLYDYLTKLRNKGEYWVDWWTRNELEDRLRENPEVINRYPDVIKCN